MWVFSWLVSALKAFFFVIGIVLDIKDICIRNWVNFFSKLEQDFMVNLVLYIFVIINFPSRYCRYISYATTDQHQTQSEHIIFHNNNWQPLHCLRCHPICKFLNTHFFTFILVIISPVNFVLSCFHTSAFHV